MLGVSVAVVVTVGVALGVATMVRVDVGRRRVGLSVPGASGGSVACVEVPGGGVFSVGAAGLAKLQASRVNDNAIKQTAR